MEFLGALEAEKLTKQKWEQYCGTPCTYYTPCKILNYLTFPRHKNLPPFLWTFFCHLPSNQISIETYLDMKMLKFHTTRTMGVKKQLHHHQFHQMSVNCLLWAFLRLQPTLDLAID